MNIVELPATAFQDIPAGLRNLADKIENGQFGAVVNVAWVLDAEYKAVEAGLLGKCANPDAVFVLLLEIAKADTIKRMAK